VTAFVHKGIAWLLLATIAQVPPVVFFEHIPCAFHRRSSPFYATGLRFSESKWYTFSPALR
jgi:hypothetical protein